VSFELEDMWMIRAGMTSLVAEMCQELRPEVIIEGLIEWDLDQVRAAPGTLAKAIAINVLYGRTPLYLLPEYFATRDTEALLELGIQPEQVNDDAVGRMFDRVAKAATSSAFVRSAESPTASMPA